MVPHTHTAVHSQQLHHIHLHPNGFPSHAPTLSKFVTHCRFTAGFTHPQVQHIISSHIGQQHTSPASNITISHTFSSSHLSAFVVHQFSPFTQAHRHHWHCLQRGAHYPTTRHKHSTRFFHDHTHFMVPARAWWAAFHQVLPTQGAAITTPCNTFGRPRQSFSRGAVWLVRVTDPLTHLVGWALYLDLADP